MGGEGQGEGAGEGGGGRTEARARRYGGEGRDGRLLPPASLDRLFPPSADNGKHTGYRRRATPLASEQPLRVQLRLFVASVVVCSFIAGEDDAVFTHSCYKWLLFVCLFVFWRFLLRASQLLIIEHLILNNTTES